MAARVGETSSIESSIHIKVIFTIKNSIYLLYLSFESTFKSTGKSTGPTASHNTGDTMNTAIITGASRGLGLALAKALAQKNWNLVINARGSDALETARSELA